MKILKENKVAIIMGCFFIALMLSLFIGKASAKEFEVPDGYVLITETHINKKVAIYEIKHKKTGCHSKVTYNDSNSTSSTETEWTVERSEWDGTPVTVPYCTKVKGKK